MAVTRGATTTAFVDSSAPISASFSHTVNASTTLLVVTFHCEGDLGISSVNWNTTEAMTGITSVTTSSAGGDCRVYAFGLVNPTAATANVSYTVSGAGDNMAAVAVNYLGTISSSVADATNAIDSEDNANGASQTVALSGTTTNGSTLVAAGTFYGGDGNPSSDSSASFNTVGEGETGTSTTTDTCYYYGDKIGGGTGGTVSPTIDWTGTANDECVGVFFEVLDTTQTLTQSSTFTNSNSLAYTHALALNLVQSSTFTNSNSLAYQHEVSQGTTLTQDSRFDNAQSYYVHVLTLYLTPTLFANDQVFYEHVLTQPQSLTQASRFDNANDLAYLHQIDLGLTQAARFDNSLTSFLHQLDLRLTQASRFDNANDLAYQHVVALSQQLTQASRFDNSHSYYAHVLRNQYPDPAEVLLGVEYGSPGLEFTGTFAGGGFDGTLKVDVASGRMVKIVSNKVVLSL